MTGVLRVKCINSKINKTLFKISILKSTCNNEQVNIIPLLQNYYDYKQKLCSNKLF